MWYIFNLLFLFYGFHYWYFHLFDSYHKINILLSVFFTYAVCI